MIHYIYKITNLKNGHYYYGRRSFKGNNIDQDAYFGSGRRLKLAIKKYGITNFKKEIVSIHDSEQELIEAEIHIVNKNTVTDPRCYNLALGGHGGFTYYMERCFTHTEESKNKISKANKGRSRPDARETLINLGINKWWAGKKRTEDDKKAKRDAAKKAIKLGKHPSKIMATCPYCNYNTTIGNAKRWHFENCKEKK